MATSGSSHSNFGLSSSETSSSDEAPRQRGRPPASRAVASKAEYYIGSDSESDAGEVRDTGGGLDLERELETVIEAHQETWRNMRWCQSIPTGLKVNLIPLINTGGGVGDWRFPVGVPGTVGNSPW